MKSIRITLFLTAVVFISMILGQLKAQAQVSYEDCDRGSKKLYIEIQVYKQTNKILPSEAIIGDTLKQNLNLLKHMSNTTTQEKVHLLESSFARCFVDLSSDEELAIQMDVEMFKKGNQPSVNDI
jgi:hypothetical protein